MIPVTFISLIVLATLAGSADPVIYSRLFGWWPVWLNVSIVDARKVQKSHLYICLSRE